MAIFPTFFRTHTRTHSLSTYLTFPSALFPHSRVTDMRPLVSIVLRWSYLMWMAWWCLKNVWQLFLKAFTFLLLAHLSLLSPIIREKNGQLDHRRTILSHHGQWENRPFFSFLEESYKESLVQHTHGYEVVLFWSGSFCCDDILKKSTFPQGPGCFSGSCICLMECLKGGGS